MNLAELMSKEWVRLVAVGVTCLVAGALLYPTKRIEEKITQKYEQEITSLKEVHQKEISDTMEKYALSIKENREMHIESEKKISKLTSEIKTLQSKQKTAYYKLIKPDGTIEIKKFTESEVNESSKVITSIQEEFKTKIDQIETKWSDIHKERVTKLQKDFDSKESAYQKTISEMTKTKTTTINERTSNIEIGMMSNKDYYGHATTTIRGPFTGGLHVDQKQEDISKQQRAETVVGAGLGFSF